MEDTVLLSWVTFLPALGAAILCFFPGKNDDAVKWTSLLFTIATCVLTFVVLDRYRDMQAESEDGLVAPLAERAANAVVDSEESGELLNDLVVRKSWISAGELNIEYYMGVDGINLPLIVLTGVISALSMLAAFSIKKQVKGFCILFLLLETGIIGCFLALDFFMFYVFWEVMLLPMYFLIGIWGGPRREYAAIKFFLFTLFGSVLMLIAIIMMYFLASVPTFDLMKLQAIGQSAEEASFASWQTWMFVLLFIGFAVKIPIVPLHTWLPDAHVEAPTPISMILAGVLLKLGGYGLIRIAYPICPIGAQASAYVIALIGVVSIIYGALAAMAQKDFKKLVAYSSVSHMGYVTLGIAVCTLTANQYSTGMNGAMFQMIAHGISSAGMFFLVGVIYERAHHRDLDRFGGMMNIMPLYGGLSIVIFFAGMGLPGLCGFFGEFSTVMAGFAYNKTMGIIAALGVILTAGYILWTIQRVFYGDPSDPSYKQFPPITVRELITIVPLIVLAIWLGVYPNIVLNWMAPDVEQLVNQMSTFFGSM